MKNYEKVTKKRKLSKSQIITITLLAIPLLIATIIIFCLYGKDIFTESTLVIIMLVAFIGIMAFSLMIVSGK